MEQSFEATFYDIIIDAKSFEDLGGLGWNVQVSKKAQEPLDDESKKQLIAELQKKVDGLKNKKDKKVNQSEKQLKEVQDKINSYTKYDQWREQDRPVIGVIGQGNKGKSFLLSKVADFALPTGHNIITKGISVKYIDLTETARYILLDSAGSSTPLLETTNFSLDMGIEPEEARKKVNAICRDKTQSEIFLQNFVIEHSNIIIAVVGQMTYSEQKMLNRIKKYGNKTLYVIHNLMNFETKEQVENYIDETLKKLMSCELKEQTFVIFNEDAGTSEKEQDEQNKLYYTEYLKTNDKEKTVTHIILASDRSEETKKYYNEPGIKYLKKLLQANTTGKKVDIIQKTIEYLAKTSGEFMEKPLVGPLQTKKRTKKEEEKKEEEKKEEEDVQNIFYEEDPNEGNKIIVKGTEIQLKKILITEIGESSYLGSGYEPRTSAMIKTIGDKKKLLIDLEITGVQPKITMRFKNESDFFYFHCKGEKKIPNAPSSSLSTQYKMKNEAINFRFKVPLGSVNINKNSQKIEYFTKKKEYNGIVRVTYEIEEEDDNVEEIDV